MGTPLNVLIVEDSEDDARLLARHLRRGGLEARCERVETPEDMAAALADEPWDVILCDYKLPKLDVPRALEIVRDSGLDIAFLVVSGTIGEERAADLMRAGAHDFVLKDNLARLVPAIERGLGEAETRRERKRAEEALEEKEQLLRAMIDNSPASIFLKDTEGRYLLVNGKFAQWLNTSAEDAVGKTIYDLVPKQTADRLTGQDRTILAMREVSEFEQESVIVDDEVRTLMTTRFPIFGHDGEVTAVGGISTDITEMRRLEEILHQAQKMDVIGQLTGGVAHDFNNLLTIIMGNLELAERAVTGDETLAKRMRSAMRAAQRGAELTQQLLAFSRRQALNPTVLDINQYVADLEDMLRRTLGETIDLRFRLRDDVWRTRLDTGQLETALINLAVNARDAMPEGGRLTIETGNAELDAQYAATHPRVRPGPYVRLAVSDTGAGIPPEIVDHVFEPFFTTKEKGKGTGLGLSMVYGFVKQSEGHVNVYSEPGQGTSVKLYFPRADTSDAAFAAVPGSATAAAGTVTILAVEDDEGVRETTELMLAGLGYRVLTAADGPAALALLEEHRDVDLVLTDVVMPGGMSGFDLGREIGERFPGVKVVYASGYAEHAVRGKGAMGDDVVILNKPYSGNDLAARIRQALETER